MQPVGQYRVYRRRDPAPSKLAYRMQRVRLARGFGRLVRIWLPLGALVAGFFWLSQNEAAQQQIQSAIAEMRQSVEERPEFMIRIVAIDGASAELSDQIRAELALDLPVSTLHMDLADLRQRVLDLTPVSSADMFMRDEGVLQVTVQERQPVMVWRNSDGIMTVDHSGHPVEILQARLERADLPLIAGEGADDRIEEARMLLAAAAPIGARVRGLVRVGERRWDVVLERDQRILLPEEGAIQALERVIALDQAQDLFERDITIIDMRLGHRPTLRMNTNAVSELRRIRGYEQGVTNNDGSF